MFASPQRIDGPVCMGNRYTPTGSFLYDRLMSASGTAGTTSFLVFLSDGLGYLAVIGILLAKTFAASDASNNATAAATPASGGGGGSGGAHLSDQSGIRDTATTRLFVNLTYSVAVIVFLLLLPATAWLRRKLSKGSREARLRQQHAPNVAGDNDGPGAGARDFTELDELGEREPFAE